jgi:hypothetical protein
MTAGFSQKSYHFSLTATSREARLQSAVATDLQMMGEAWELLI